VITTYNRLFRAEWVKLRSLRSSGWTLSTMVVAGIGFSALLCALTASHWSHVSAANRATWDPTNQSLVGTVFGQLAIGVLGVLAVTSEYTSGTIRSTIAAVPRRTPVLVAKAVVYGGVALVAGEIISLASFFIGQTLFGSKVPHASFTQPGVARAVLLAGVYLALVCLLAIAIGAALRHTAGAITAVVAILLVLPGIVSAIPGSFAQSVSWYLPPQLAGSSMGAVVPEPGALGPWAATAVLVGYVAVAMLVAGRLLVRRDV